MIRFQFISGENGNLRILYHNQQKQSPTTTDKRCNVNEVLDLSIRLNSLLNEINQNLHKRVELFNIFKIKAKVLFDICFLNFSNDIENEKDSALPQIIIEFDVNLGFIPFESFYTGKYFLTEYFQLIRNITTPNPSSQNFITKNNHNEINLAGNFSCDKDINDSVEKELSEISNLFEKNKVPVIGPILGPFGDKNEIRSIFSSSNIFHYSGHLITNSQNQSGWKWNNNTIIDVKDLIGQDNCPAFVFSNTCGSEKISNNSHFIYELRNNGVNSILYSSGLINTEFSKKFAILFYQEFIKGNDIGLSLLNTRKLFIEKFGYSNPCWVQYNILGDSNFQLKNIKKKPESGPISFLLIALMFITFFSILSINMKNLVSDKLDYKYLTVKSISNSNNLEIFNSYGHFVDPKKPLKIKNHDLFTFYANGFDSLSLEFKLLNSQLKIHPKTINQFIFANKLYNIIELTEDTLYINLINNGLCEIDILQKSNVQKLYFGFKDNENINPKRNWSILDSNLSMIKIDPYFNNDLFLLIIQNGHNKYFKLNCQSPICNIQIEISEIWNLKSNCWQYIGF